LNQEKWGVHPNRIWLAKIIDQLISR
jgi:hypothetical protein